MAERYIIVLDQGSSGSRASALDQYGNSVLVSRKNISAAYGRGGRAEYEAEDLWRTQYDSLREVLDGLPASGTVSGIAITTQRSTVALWDKINGKALAPVMSWQDGRSAGMPRKKQLTQEKVKSITGLYDTPYYSAPKIMWALHYLPEVKKAAGQGTLMAGPVGTYILWRLSRGKAFFTDPSLAQRTLLMDINGQNWSETMLESFGVPKDILPEIRPSSGIFAETEICGRNIPVAAMLGDQQAAMLGLGVTEKGEAALNYGTGAFLMVNTGNEIADIPGLITSFGWKSGPHAAGTRYFSESTVNSAGTAMEWLKERFGFFKEIREVDDACRASRHRLLCLPALGGIGAPYWDFSAYTTFTGLSASSDKNDIVRGVTEGIAFMLADSLDRIAEKGYRPETLRASGGLSKIDYLMQFQADLTGAEIKVMKDKEATTYGAGRAAADALGINWPRGKDIPEKTFSPSTGKEERDRLLRGWRDFVCITRDASAKMRALRMIS